MLLQDLDTCEEIYVRVQITTPSEGPLSDVNQTRTGSGRDSRGIEVPPRGPFTPSVRVNATMTLVTYLSLKRTESLYYGLRPPSGATLFVSIDVNENYIASVIVPLILTLGVNGPLSVQILL